MKRCKHCGRTVWEQISGMPPTPCEGTGVFYHHHNGNKTLDAHVVLNYCISCRDRAVLFFGTQWAEARKCSSLYARVVLKCLAPFLCFVAPFIRVASIENQTFISVNNAGCVIESNLACNDNRCARGKGFRFIGDFVNMLFHPTEEHPPTALKILCGDGTMVCEHSVKVQGRPRIIMVDRCQAHNPDIWPNSVFVGRHGSIRSSIRRTGLLPGFLNLRLHFSESERNTARSISIGFHKVVVSGLRNISLLLSIVGIDRDNNECCDGYKSGDPEYPPITPNFDAVEARWLSIVLVVMILLCSGCGIWLINSAAVIEDVSDAIRAYKLTVGLVLVALVWPLVHAALDLSDYGCIYGRDLL